MIFDARSPGFAGLTSNARSEVQAAYRVYRAQVEAWQQARALTVFTARLGARPGDRRPALYRGLARIRPGHGARAAAPTRPPLEERASATAAYRRWLACYAPVLEGQPAAAGDLVCARMRAMRSDLGLRRAALLSSVGAQPRCSYFRLLQLDEYLGGLVEDFVVGLVGLRDRSFGELLEEGLAAGAGHRRDAQRDLRRGAERPARLPLRRRLDRRRSRPARAARLGRGRCLRQCAAHPRDARSRPLRAARRRAGPRPPGLARPGRPAPGRRPLRRQSGRAADGRAAALLAAARLASARSTAATSGAAPRCPSRAAPPGGPRRPRSAPATRPAPARARPASRSTRPRRCAAPPSPPCSARSRARSCAGPKCSRRPIRSAPAPAIRCAARTRRARRSRSADGTRRLVAFSAPCRRPSSAPLVTTPTGRCWTSLSPPAGAISTATFRPRRPTRFRAAFSKGRHFNAHIRDHYDFTEVAERDLNPG